MQLENVINETPRETLIAQSLIDMVRDALIQDVGIINDAFYNVYGAATSDSPEFNFERARAVVQSLGANAPLIFGLSAQRVAHLIGLAGTVGAEVEFYDVVINPPCDLVTTRDGGYDLVLKS